MPDLHFRLDTRGLGGYCREEPDADRDSKGHHQGLLLQKFNLEGRQRLKRRRHCGIEKRVHGVYTRYKKMNNMFIGCTLGLLFLPTISGAIAPTPYYILLIPAELHYPSMETACLLLVDSRIRNTNQYSIIVNLEVQGKVIPLFRLQSIMVPFICQKFTVPAPSDGNSEIGRVYFIIEGVVNESKNVLIQRKEPEVVIQTDKPSYRPSDLVRFRMVTLDENFLCAKSQYNIVELKDPKNNRINQWLNVINASCIIDLSFQLSSEPILGTYTINVENGKGLQTFYVEEEVLPRFEVIIEKPLKIISTDPLLPLRVCGRYTYGRGVPGNVAVILCRTVPGSEQNSGNCMDLNAETDVNGCLDTSVNISSLQSIKPFYYNIKLDVIYTERGTGVQFTVSKTIPASSASVTLKFEKMDSYYKTGLPYKITLVAQDWKGEPLKSTATYIEVTTNGITRTQYAFTDNMGKARFNFITTSWSGKVVMHGMMGKTFTDKLQDTVFQDAFHEVNPYYSEAKSLVQLVPVYGTISCMRNINIRVEYDIKPDEISADDGMVNFYYLVIGKAGIVLSGYRLVGPSLQGFFTIPITFTTMYGTAPKMIVFLILKDGTVAADRLLFNVEMCFTNKAMVYFSTPSASPKDQLNLLVESSAGSVCALRGVDKSVQISHEEKELTAEAVSKLFKFSTRGGYPDSVQEQQFDPCWWPIPIPRPIPDPEAMIRKIRPIYGRDSNWVDVFSLFKEIGVKILTNTQILKPQIQTQICPLFAGNLVFASMVAKPVSLIEEISPILANDDEAVRNYFPETWLWDLVSVGNSGKSVTAVTVPDTITQFNARVFCMGKDGFALSPEASLTVFKPFFVDLVLPYSIVQGETFTLKASIFNYMQQCLKVQVTLVKSSEFTQKLCQDCVNPACVCPNQVTTFKWDFTAEKLGLLNITVRAEAVSSTDTCEGQQPYVPPTGKLDILQRNLLVKPRGIRKEVTENIFLCQKDSIKNFQKTISLKIPKTWVEKSESAYINVMGDILGSMLQNLDKLITMPYGCGEQNMLTMAPIIYVVGYLESTGQFSQEQKNKAINYLQSGYQRELSYKHSDGSFSAFGESDGVGSTWLTAFVMKCFYQARDYIFIDDDVLKQTVSWLQSQQQSNGCFTSIGKLFHTLMKGGVEDDLSLSAYITSALLEGGIAKNNPIVVRALSCLKARVSRSSNPYTMALLAYTFALADDTETKKILMDKLNPLAVSSGGDLYWQYNLQSSTVSAGIELSSYILLALITSPKVNPDDILRGSQIVKWLSKQQNSNGGFLSTQDTVVAIQALAKYTKITFIPDASLSVAISTAQGPLKQFTVDKTNRLLLQTAPLPNVPGEYNLLVTGIGCVYIQSVVKYNELPVSIPAAFTISAKIENCRNSSGVFTLSISASYTGSRKTSNMVIIEVGMLSGFSPSGDLAIKLLKFPLVKKINVKLDLVTIYLDELNENRQEYRIEMKQDIIVNDLKPANVKIYDYYQPEENAVTTYESCA